MREAVLVAIRDMEEMCVFGLVPKLNFFSVNTVVGCWMSRSVMLVGCLPEKTVPWNLSPDVYQ